MQHINARTPEVNKSDGDPPGPPRRGDPDRLPGAASAAVARRL